MGFTATPLEYLQQLQDADDHHDDAPYLKAHVRFLRTPTIITTTPPI